MIISRSMTHPTGITGPHEHGFDGGAAMVEATPLYSIININDGQSEGGFGGNFSKFQPIGIGKKISLHFSMYIPEEYDFTTNTIALKFVRFHAVTAEGNHDGYVDVMIKNDGFVINSAEISPRKNTVISHPIPRGRWFTVRIDGLINIVGDLKLVVDEQIVADLNDISWVSDGFVDKILFFTYWNGGAPKKQSLFLRDVVIDTDASGVEPAPEPNPEPEPAPEPEPRNDLVAAIDRLTAATERMADAISKASVEGLEGGPIGRLPEVKFEVES